MQSMNTNGFYFIDEAFLSVYSHTEHVVILGVKRNCFQEKDSLKYGKGLENSSVKALEVYLMAVQNKTGSPGESTNCLLELNKIKLFFLSRALVHGACLKGWAQAFFPAPEENF
jgi:hypothetical protein